MKGTKGRILFVDDNPDTCDLVSTSLGMAGYDVITAATVTEGLRMAKVEDFDLILLDWFFNDGTGVELCQMIRTFDTRTPIFFYTGVAYPHELQKAMDAGAQGCFIKPVDLDSFLEVISQQLQSNTDYRTKH